MARDFRCPYCDFGGLLPRTFTGGRVKCPGCGGRILIAADRTAAVVASSPATPPAEAARPTGPPVKLDAASEVATVGALECDEAASSPGETAPGASTVIEEIEEELESRPRRRIAAVALAAACVFAAGVAGGMLLRPSLDPSPPPAPAADTAVGRTPEWSELVQDLTRLATPPEPPAAPAIPAAAPARRLGLGPPASAEVDAVPVPVRADPLETVRRIKDATVYLKVGEGSNTSSGSGFVVRAEGETVYIATNHHVVQPRDSGRGGGREDVDLPPIWPAITAVFRSGDTTGREASRPARVVAHDRRESRDLALLIVEGLPDAPRPIDVEGSAEPAETTPLFIHGFPFGDLDRLIDRDNRRNPSITISGGRVSSLRRGEGGRVALVQIDGALNPGNSGGPVVDEQGRLVGVAVAHLANANIGFAVPASDLALMLGGRTGRILVRPAATRQGEVDLEVRVGLIDPFNRIEYVEVLTGGQPASPEPHRRDWPEMPDSDRTPLNRRGDIARGIVRVAGDPGATVTLQVVARNALNQPFVDKPFTFVIPPGPEAVASGTEIDSTRPASVDFTTLLDPSKSCLLTRRGDALTIEVPPGAYALGPEFAPRAAPMALAEVDGDFDLRVQVDGAMIPGLEPLKLKGHPLPNTYQGQGLILFDDKGNYLRIERGASAQRPRPEVQCEVVTEMRSNGRAEPPRVEGVPEGPLDIRIVRSQDAVRCMFGRDGHWSATHLLAMRFPKKVRVGLIATNLSKEPLVARFLKPSLVLGVPKEE